MTRYKRTRHSPEFMAAWQAFRAKADLENAEAVRTGTLRNSAEEHNRYLYDSALNHAAAPESDTETAADRNEAESPRVKDEG